MNIRHLSYLLALDRERHFARAAEGDRVLDWARVILADPLRRLQNERRFIDQTPRNR